MKLSADQVSAYCEGIRTVGSYPEIIHIARMSRRRERASRREVRMRGEVYDTLAKAGETPRLIQRELDAFVDIEKADAFSISLVQLAKKLNDEDDHIGSLFLQRCVELSGQPANNFEEIWETLLILSRSDYGTMAANGQHFSNWTFIELAS